LYSKYLISRVVGALLIFGITVAIVNAALPLSEESKSGLYKEKRRIFKETAHTLDAVTVGNSHGLAFHFDSLGLKGMHFWETAGDMEESLYKTNVILDYATSLEYIFLGLSPGSLRTSQRVLAHDYTTRKMRVSNSLPFSWNWRTLSIEDTIGGAVFNYFPVNIIQNLFYQRLGYNPSEQLVSDEEKNACFRVLESNIGDKINVSTMEDGILDGYRHALIQPECIERFAKRKAKDTRFRIDKTASSNPDILSENMDRVRKIADLAMAAGAQLVIVTPPTTKASYDTEEIQSLVAPFQQAISELEKHENIVYYDFHDLYFDKVDEKQNDYFYDGDHLAITGSKDFSSILRQAMGI